MSSGNGVWYDIQNARARRHRTSRIALTAVLVVVDVAGACDVGVGGVGSDTPPLMPPVLPADSPAAAATLPFVVAKVAVVALAPRTRRKSRSPSPSPSPSATPKPNWKATRFCCALDTQRFQEHVEGFVVVVGFKKWSVGQRRRLRSKTHTKTVAIGAHLLRSAAVEGFGLPQSVRLV